MTQDHERQRAEARRIAHFLGVPVNPHVLPAVELAELRFLNAPPQSVSPRRPATAQHVTARRVFHSPIARRLFNGPIHRAAWFARAAWFVRHMGTPEDERDLKRRAVAAQRQARR